MNDLDAISRAHRLQTLGIVVRSPELAGKAQEIRDFYARGGNRAMRRATKRARRRQR